MAQPQRSHQPIPSFYRVFFTSIDPLIALSGAYLSLFDPGTVLASSFDRSSPYAVPTPAITVLLTQAAGALSVMAFLMVFMLRRTDDIVIWKLFESSILIADVALFRSLWQALEAQGRLDVTVLRAEEWGTIAITGFVTLMRVLFVSGVGFGVREHVKKD